MNTTLEQTSSAFDLYKNSSDCDMSMIYRGPFLDDITDKIVSISENTVAEAKGDAKTSRKVSFLLVECFQNIVRHGEAAEDVECEKQVDDGLFSYQSIGGKYYINSINLIKEEEAIELCKRIEHVNNSDAVSLKEMYKERLTAEFNERGGAGLGLIEMARKSKQKLFYKVDPAVNGYCLFHQQISVNKSTDDAGEGINLIDNTKFAYEVMVRDNVLIEYKGDFSQGSVLPLINIVEQNLMKANKKIGKLKRAVHLLIEMLQNVAQHGYEKEGMREGIFVIGKKDDGLDIETGNVMHIKGVDALRASMDRILSLSEEELKEAHKEQIKAAINSEDKNNSGLGLMEIAHMCKGNLSYEIKEYEAENSFFSLHAHV